MQNQQKASSFKLKSKYAENLRFAWVFILISKSRRSTTSKTEEKCEANFSPDTSNNCISIVPSKFWLAWAKNLQNNLQRNCFFWSAPLVSPNSWLAWDQKLAKLHPTQMKLKCPLLPMPPYAYALLALRANKLQKYIQRKWSWSFPCSLCLPTVTHCWLWKPEKMQRYIQRTWSWSFPCSLCFRTVTRCWIES